MPFINTSVENIINIKQLVCLYHMNIHDYYRDVGETHNFWELVYVKNGRITEHSDDRVDTLYEGDVCFHHPGEEHWTEGLDSNHHAEIFCITFECTSKAMKYFNNYKTTLSDTSKELIEKCLNEASMYYMVSEINRKHTLSKSPNATIGGAQMYKMYLEAFLISLLREMNEQNNSIFVSQEDIYSIMVEKIDSYLMEHVYDDINLDDLSKYFSYSKPFLCHHYKRITNNTIINQLQNLRIDEACRLISSKKYSFTKIAEMLQFSDLHYFSKAFKKKTGITPSEYKKRHMVNENI